MSVRNIIHSLDDLFRSKDLISNETAEFKQILNETKGAAHHVKQSVVLMIKAITNDMRNATTAYPKIVKNARQTATIFVSFIHLIPIAVIFFIILSLVWCQLINFTTYKQMYHQKKIKFIQPNGYKLILKKVKQNDISV